MATYEPTWIETPVGEDVDLGSRALGNAVLIQNTRWFTSIRWIVVAVLALVGMAGLAFPRTIINLGFNPPNDWPWLLVGALVCANAVFCVLRRRLRADMDRHVIKTHLWAQIITDLLIVTAMVHMVGSVDTFFGFTYLFHIALACIFFPRKESLLVTLIASALYLGLVGIEHGGWLMPRSILLATALAPPQLPLPSLVLAGSAVAVWIVVWYLVSTLSETVRNRDNQLLEANKRLIQADQEKNKQVLRVTHDLKAPFTGIESNIQIIRFKFWDEIPTPVKELIERIQARAHTLSERIRDILTLGDLRSSDVAPTELVAVSLRAAIEQAVDGLRDKAVERRVTINADVPDIYLLARPRPVEVLFANLISNAVFYSHEGGTVDLLTSEEHGTVWVRVRDRGIGISTEALPHIFDEFYRAKEAMQFNELSTGLGLPIVATIAHNLGLKLRVSSEQGEGTLFEVCFKKADKPA